MTQEAKAAYRRGYEQGQNDMLAVMEWMTEWRATHPDSTEEEAEAAFLAVPREEILGKRSPME